LQERLNAGRQWLAGEAPARYTVQLSLIDAASPEKLEQFLRDTEARIGTSQLHIFETGLGGIARVGVTHGSFANRSDAAAAINELTQRWGYKPQIRTVNGIRTEILRTTQTVRASQPSQQTL
jgi:septal ring-binding cell division protein DamX